jgi:hypothetical protein
LFNRQDRRADEVDVGPTPSSTLTRWLRQGIERHMCPLCRVAHKADREYIWQFSEEGFGDEETMESLARAHGFCQEHAEMLRRIDVATQSMLGISTIYVELFADLAAELAALDVAQAYESGACPACANREAALRKNARYLLSALTATAGSIAEGFPSSPGLCFAHFELVWASGGTPQVRRLILDVQRRAVAEVLSDLHEFVRKEGAEFKHEPKAKEQDAWQRAIWLDTGWPAPTASASVPEARPTRNSRPGSPADSEVISDHARAVAKPRALVARPRSA